MVRGNPKIAFAFAGMHYPEEMAYLKPFFASIVAIQIGFLEPAATRKILTDPARDFPLDYKPEALDLIYELTAGQPYLVQLVGFQLVRHYNEQVFYMGNYQDPIFTAGDVKAAINDPEFFQRGRYYFDGVWGQAARGARGQQEILRAITPHPQGLTLETIALSVAANEQTVREALNTLQRHQVVKESRGLWSIVVQLLGQWILKL